MGMASGFAMPAPASLWATWAPPVERGRLAGFSFSGTIMGIICKLILYEFFITLLNTDR